MDTLQRARDIAADTYVRMATTRLEEKGPPDGPTLKCTADEWREHIASFSQIMRDGAYDAGLEVQIALAALNQVPANGRPD